MEEKSTATLEKIQRAAMEEFTEKGFQWVPPCGRSWKQAGVTTGALYGYFSSKRKRSLPPSWSLTPLR